MLPLNSASNGWGIITEPLRDGRARLAFEYRDAGLVIPAGFISDGATVPRVLWWLIPPFAGRYARAVWRHDYRYSRRAGSRKRADQLFLRDMLDDGVNSVKARTMYAGVRVVGFLKWRT